MNIVCSNGSYQIYGDSVQTFKTLPVQCYEIAFNKFTGFYLAPKADLVVTEEKIYGSLTRKVNKTLRSYDAMIGRNFGVLLSGEKGIGKSLFVRILAKEGLKRDLPVIITSIAIPGIANFISSIAQDCIVIFDEFEKVFASTDDYNPQDDMLSLFDGIDGGHKLFIVTCNDLSKISSYMLNRPGRFHYHFTLGTPGPDEVREYLLDKIEKKYVDKIEEIVNISGAVSLPYDCLRAIAFEINQGYDLKEVFSDLNITKTDDVRFDVKVYLKDGSCYEDWNTRIDLTDQHEGCWLRVRSFTQKREFSFNFYPGFAKLINGQYILTDHIQSPRFDEDDFWDLPESERAAAVRAANENTIEKVVMTRCPTMGLTRLLV